MFKLLNILNVFKTKQALDASVSKNAKNWFEEQYDTIIVQRNMLFAIIIGLLMLSLTSLGVLLYVANLKEFEPFVVQIEKDTGVATIVDPKNSSLIQGNEALAKYFIKKYVIARESYNPVDFGKESDITIRLLSTSSVYWAYRGYLRNDQVNPLIKYGSNNTTYLIDKSWSKLADKKFIFRFSIHETAGAINIYHKIAIVEFDYIDMELTNKERDINPIGFQITGYRVDDDNI